jgi:hypothetical protein
MNDVAYVSVNVVAASLFVGDPAGARTVAREGWRLAPVYDLQAPWGDYFAFLAALEGRLKSACLLLGYADARYGAMTFTRYGIEVRAADQAATLAAAGLTSAEIAMLRREGRNLDDASASTLAFAANDWEG